MQFFHASIVNNKSKMLVIFSCYLYSKLFIQHFLAEVELHFELMTLTKQKRRRNLSTDMRADLLQNCLLFVCLCGHFAVCKGYVTFRKQLASFNSQVEQQYFVNCRYLTNMAILQVSMDSSVCSKLQHVASKLDGDMVFFPEPSQSTLFVWAPGPTYYLSSC